jgi:hypothetical protein
VLKGHVTKRTTLVATAHQMFGMPNPQYLNAIAIAASQAIADIGATSIFIMEGTPCKNLRPAIRPLTINLPDGTKVNSTHTCDITIPGLPKVLVGHMVTKLTIALLIRIRVLCNAGCKVVFTKNKCDVWYNRKIILCGNKDPSTALWMLPINKDIEEGMQPINEPTSAPLQMVCPTPKKRTTLPLDAHNGVAHVASFTHSIKTRANGVRFAHQSLCNPKISTLLKAVRRGFLDKCPNLSEKLINKYLNASPATAKGHMKCPRHGIRSTTPKPIKLTEIQPVREGTHLLPQAPALAIPIQIPPPHVMPNYTGPNLIGDEEDDASIANVFCFGVFADKQSGVMYNDLTRNFPFILLDGSVCFLVMYHYESNAIFAIPIAGLDDVTIFEAYKKKFDKLAAKGLKVKINIMDNQATKHIRKFLNEEQCKLQLVEPHNHRMNAAEQAIQTWKDAFIAVLATTDRDFPIQLWDRLAPQVQDALNLLRASRIDPTKSAY